MRYQMDVDTHQDLKELIEDSLEFFCDNYMVSGELAWLCVEALAVAKIESMKGGRLHD